MNSFTSNREWLDRAFAVNSPDALPRDRLISWLKNQGIPVTGKLKILQYPGGHSNVTYLLQDGESEFVLRHPPHGVQIKSGHDMSREFKVIQALFPEFRKVPKPIVFCEDTSIIAVPFYLMEKVTGIILRKKIPTQMEFDHPQIHRIVHAYIETLVSLHRLDIRETGLSDLGRPKGYISRQITGWSNRYKASKVEDVPAIDKLIEWLIEHQIEEHSHSIIHNDYKFDNIIYSPDSWTEIKAILDWEMCTLGDPFMDLGTSLAMWTTPSDLSHLNNATFIPLAISSVYTREDLIALYEKESGLQMPNVIFYYAVSMFKMAIVAQQLYFRHFTGKSKDPRLAAFDEAAKNICITALQAIQKNRLDDLFY